MNPIHNRLAHSPLLVLDGALATELERRGCDLNNSLWSAKVLLENPELIAAVHNDYLDAGADCIISASYQASFEGFRNYGLSAERSLLLLQQSVRLAIMARDSFWNRTKRDVDRFKPLVAVSIGPYGAYLADGSEYHGQYSLTEHELCCFHRERLQVLIGEGPDLLACETLPCLWEAKVLVEELKKYENVYGWVSFSARDGLHISSGEKIRDCARWLDGHEQVAAVGVNCTAPEHIISLISEIRRGTSKPIVVYPNSGEHYDVGKKTWHGASHGSSYAEEACAWFNQGASIIGGCCRTTPEDIRAISAWARNIG